MAMTIQGVVCCGLGDSITIHMLTTNSVRAISKGVQPMNVHKEAAENINVPSSLY